MTSKRRLRTGVKWLVGGLWAATTLTILVLLQIHPRTSVQASLNLAEISFWTSAQQLLSPLAEQQLLVSGIAAIDLAGPELTVEINGHTQHAGGTLRFIGHQSSSCSFYRVESSSLRLTQPMTHLTLVPRESTHRGDDFTFRSHGAVTAELTTQPRSGQLVSAFECDNIGPADRDGGEVSGTFSVSGGDSAVVTSAPDAQLDFRGTTGSSIDDTGIRIANPIRFSHIDPGPPSVEKSTLLDSSAAAKNQIIFTALPNRAISLEKGDLLLISPGKEFYLKRFETAPGEMRAVLQGSVQDVQSGAGPADLHSQMPSLFDHLDSWKRFYSVIPAIVGLVLGVLEKMGLLPKT